MPRQPVDAVARDPAPGARDGLPPLLSATGARVRLTPEGDALRRARARHAGALAAAASAICAAARAQLRGQHRDLRVGDRLPELPARASWAASASATPTSTSSSRPATPPTRWRCWPRGASTSRSRRCRARVPRAAGRRACCCTRRWCSSAPRVRVRGRASVARRGRCPGPSCRSSCRRRGLARASADRWFRAQRIAPRVYGEVPGSEAILALVSLGCGVGIVPRLVMDKSPLRAERPRAATAARARASSASASAPSAASCNRRWCARSGTLSAREVRNPLRVPS